MRYSSKSSRPRLFGWFRVGAARPELTDRPDTTTEALRTTLRRDTTALAALVVLAALTLLEVVSWLLPALDGVARYLPLAHLAVAVAVLLAGIRRVIHKEERRLWNGVALAFGLRLVAAAVVLVAGRRTLWTELFSDIVYALALLALIIAVERPIQRRGGIHSTDLGRILTWPGGSVFALGLLVYFSLISAAVNPASYASTLPSFYMLLIFELYIVLKLAVFGTTTESLRWRMLYSLLYLVMLTLLLKDTIDCLLVAEVLPAEFQGASRLLWSLPFFLLVAAARLRHHSFPTEESLFDSVSRKDPLPWPHGNIVTYALVFPLIHFVFHATGLLPEESKGAREVLALTWLLIFGAMALLQQRLLERRARSLWLERMRAEEALHKSNETLRLVNERSQAEEALRKSEEKFLKAFRSIPDSMVISTLAEGRIREVNESFEKYFGYRREEVLGKTGVELDIWVELEDRAMMTRILRERGMVRNFEFEFYNKVGDKRLALLSGEIIDLEGETCLLMVLRDITERKLTEDKIHEQAELLDKARDAISVRDLDGRIIYWNKSAERLYSWSADEVVGRNVDGMLHKTGSGEIAVIQREVLERGEWTGRLEQLRRDGTPVVVESRWTLVRNELKEPVSLLVINTDVTDKHHLEVRLRRAERLESIGAVTSGIAHDLSSLMTPVLMTAETLREAQLDKKYEPLIGTLLENARRGADMVRHVLTFAGQGDAERVSFQPKYLINDMERVARESFPATIELRIVIPEQPWTIVGDAGPLHQVLWNLCTNSCDALGEAGGTLRIEAENVWMDKFYARRHSEAQEGPYVVITVSDTGSGILPEHLDKVWDPFFSTKPDGEGSGLSLAMSRAIVRAQGGFMTVYSEVGTGSSFQIYLPATPRVEGEPAEEPPELPAGHGERILVVDDDAAIRDIILQTLEAFGYAVTTASSGAEAVEIYGARRDTIDLVFLDMMMPVMDGFATVRELVALDPEVEIVAVSGLVTKEKVKEVENVRVFLEKPYTAEKLLTTLRDVLAPRES